MLHRTADAAGQQAWLSLMRSGQVTVGSLAEAILSSDEFFGLAVAASQR
jgi:hypothetical protein